MDSRVAGHSVATAANSRLPPPLFANMTNENLPAEQPPEGEFLLYQTEDGQTRIECRFAGNTIWLTQRMMAELFPFHLSPSIVRANSSFSAGGDHHVTTSPGKTGTAGTAML